MLYEFDKGCTAVVACCSICQFHGEGGNVIDGITYVGKITEAAKFRQGMHVLHLSGSECNLKENIKS